jgi:hypothetical protein
MNAHGLRVRICGLETDIETLMCRPDDNRKDIAILAAEVARLRRRLGEQTGADYAVALELCFYEKAVRVIADNRWEARRLEAAWLSRHRGGGVTSQRASYCQWALPLLASVAHDQRRSA